MTSQRDPSLMSPQELRREVAAFLVSAYIRLARRRKQEGPLGPCTVPEASPLPMPHAGVGQQVNSSASTSAALARVGLTTCPLPRAGASMPPLPIAGSAGRARPGERVRR